MKLYEKPFSSLRLGRKTYSLRLTFARVLYALDAIQAAGLTEQDRMRLLLRVLVKGSLPRRPGKQAALLTALCKAIEQPYELSPPPEQAAKPIMSLTQDAPLIYAAFRQTYGIDLHRTELPWADFCELLTGLPGNTRLCEVAALRARPVPPPDGRNTGLREALLKAKAAVALQLTDEQRQTAYQAGLNQLAQRLIAWADDPTKDGETT